MAFWGLTTLILSGASTVRIYDDVRIYFCCSKALDMSDDDDDDGDYAYDLPKPFVIMMSGIKSCRDSRPSGGLWAQLTLEILIGLAHPVGFGCRQRSGTIRFLPFLIYIWFWSPNPFRPYFHRVFICIYYPLLFYHIFRNHIKNETSTLFSSTNYNVTMNYYTVRAAAPTYDVLFPLVDYGWFMNIAGFHSTTMGGWWRW